LIDQEEMFFMVAAYRLGVAARVGAGAATGLAGGGAATMRTVSPSARKPAPSTTTRASGATPSTAELASVRDRTVTGWNFTLLPPAMTKTPGLLSRYRTAAVGTVSAGWSPTSMRARANMPGRRSPGLVRLMRATPRRVWGSTS